MHPEDDNGTLIVYYVVIMSTSSVPTIWLIKDAEPLPLDNKQRLMRTGLLAEELHKRGYNVVWFASRFEHARKSFVEGPPERKLKDNFIIQLLDGPGYKRNISLARIGHQRALATDFLIKANTLPKPDLVVASYPSPELCLAACRYAKSNNIPVFVDARDPWPDSFAEYFPKGLRFLITPVVYGYRKLIRECFRIPDGVLSMSKNMLVWALSYAGRPKGANDSVFYLGYKAPVNVSIKSVPSKFSEAETLNLVFVGTFGKSYDVGSIIEAVKLLTPDEQRMIKCHLVGQGQYLSKWQQEAKNLPSIIFHGWKDGAGISEILADSHAGLIPIKGGVTQFWMGNKLFEYAAFGIALINSVPREVAELVDERQFGINVPSGDSTAIAKVIREYLGNPQLLSRHRQNALSLFKERFDGEKIYSDYAEHVLKLLKVNDRQEQISAAV